MEQHNEVLTPTPAAATATATDPATNPGNAPAVDPATRPQTLVLQLRAMRELIPEYTQLRISEAQSLRVIATGTDPQFVQATINGVGASLNVQQALGRTPEELRQETADAASWTAVEDEARALLKGVVAANLVRRHRIGQTALAAYAIASRLSRQQEHANLLPHVEMMKRLNRFGVKKRTKPAQPAPAPTTPPAPTPHPAQ